MPAANAELKLSATLAAPPTLSHCSEKPLTSCASLVTAYAYVPSCVDTTFTALAPTASAALLLAEPDTSAPPIAAPFTVRLTEPARNVVAVTVSAADAQNGGVVVVPPLAVPVQLGPQVGDSFPRLALTDPAGQPIDLNALKGKPVLLHAWAGWCANCPRDYAAIRKLRADVPAAKLAVVGLNFDEDAATAGRLAAKSEFAWPQACVGILSAQAVADRLAVSGVPLYLVFDADGVVAFRGYSFADAEKAARAEAK